MENRFERADEYYVEVILRIGLDDGCPLLCISKGKGLDLRFEGREDAWYENTTLALQRTTVGAHR